MLLFDILFVYIKGTGGLKHTCVYSEFKPEQNRNEQSYARDIKWPFYWIKKNELHN